MMPLADAVSALAFETLAATRPTGAFVAGVWTPAAATAFTLQASATQASGRDLQRLPEGRRTTGGIRLITTTELRVGDRVTWQGSDYEVGAVANWSAVGGFWDAIASQVER